MVRQRDFSAFSFKTLQSAELTAEELADVLSLFRGAYRDANASYIEKSLARLRFLVLAYKGETPAGFAMGEQRLMDVPRLPGTVVSLAGICCIDLRFRRQGLFGRLEGLALGASGKGMGADRRLSCGRMAHPASFKGMSGSPSVVPRRGQTPSRWQQEVGQAVADAYGVYRFDPETFVCLGSGTPIGYPIIDVEATPAEWEVFRPVDRDRGDALLGISWGANPPSGWDSRE